MFSTRQRVASDSKSLLQGTLCSLQHQVWCRWFHLRPGAIFILPGSLSPVLPSSAVWFITAWHHCCCPWDSGRKDRWSHVTVQSFFCQPRMLGALLGRLHWISCDGPMVSLFRHPPWLIRGQRKWCGCASFRPVHPLGLRLSTIRVCVSGVEGYGWESHQYRWSQSYIISCRQDYKWSSIWWSISEWIFVWLIDIAIICLLPITSA